MIAKLTKRVVDATAPASADVFIWDGNHPEAVSGFGLKVTPKGRRVFIYQYWSPILHRTRRRLTIGTYGSLTVDQAREAARKLAGLIAHGEDPAATRRQAREEALTTTVEQLMGDWFEEIAPKRSERTMESYTTHRDRYIVPAIGKLPVSHVTHADVAKLHSGLKSKPTTANRVVTTLSSFMSWCERRGMRTRGSNPCIGIERFDEQGRERFLTVAEVAALGDALRQDELEGLPTPPRLRKPRKEGKTKRGTDRASHIPKSLAPVPGDPYAIAAIRFLLLTGWREQEALTLRWTDVDEARGHATLGDTKTGKSHRPLGAAALELLERLPRVRGNPYVFVGSRPGRPLTDVRRTWEQVRHAAGLDDVRLHDLRHTVASFSVGAGHSLFLTGSLLGHLDPSTTKRYAHLQDDARRATADSVSGAIAAAMGPGSQTPVVPIANARGSRKRA